MTVKGISRYSLDGLEDFQTKRSCHLTELVVCVDGLPGCGKTMLSPIVGALDRVELGQYAYQIEYTCALQFLEKISNDGSSTLVRLLSDLQLYNVMMSRETNFRLGDLSSVWCYSKPWRYIKRLFQPGDEVVISRVKEENPILHLITHIILGISQPLFDAMGDRLRIIVVDRHPLYMIKQQQKYMHRMGNDIRDFSVWFEYGNYCLPWFAKGWEEKFFKANVMDQAIFMMEEIGNLRKMHMDKLGEAGRAQILEIPFEPFVVDPWPYMRKMEAFLNTKATNRTRREMKRQNIPRKMYAEGIGLPIYRQYGWQPPNKDSNEHTEFQLRREFVESQASPEAMEVLNRLCSEYESKHLKGVLQ